jgi:hypothetical protein
LVLALRRFVRMLNSRADRRVHFLARNETALVSLSGISGRFDILTEGRFQIDGYAAKRHNWC